MVIWPSEDSFSSSGNCGILKLFRKDVIESVSTVGSIFFFCSESIWYIWVFLVLTKRSTASVDENAGNGELPKVIADITQIDGNVFVPVS